MSESDGFLSRWSRLKRERRRRGGAAPVLEEAETPTSQTAEPPPASEAGPERRADPAAPGAAAVAGAPGEAAAPPPDLPPVESLTRDSDFTVFLKENVPEHLRRLALRKLWRSDPVFANLDGLNDYDEDFRALMQAVKAVATNYKVGRGFLRDEAEVGEAEVEGEAPAPAEPGAAEERPAERQEPARVAETGRTPEAPPGSPEEDRTTGPGPEAETSTSAAGKSTKSA